MRLVRKAAGVSEVKRRRLFSGDADVHVRFKYRGQPCIVWEPYGDSSRYWIGPEDPETLIGNLQEIERVFDTYCPPRHRTMLGNLLSLHLRQ